MGDGYMSCALFDKNTGTCNGGNWCGGKSNQKPDSHTKKHYCLGNDSKHCKHHFQNSGNTSIQKDFDDRAFNAKFGKWVLIGVISIIIFMVRPELFEVIWRIFTNILDFILGFISSFLYL